MSEEEINYLITAQKQLDAAFISKIKSEKSAAQLHKCLAIMTENKTIDNKIRNAIIIRMKEIAPEYLESKEFLKWAYEN
jgi:hypothetical protein